MGGLCRDTDIQASDAWISVYRGRTAPVARSESLNRYHVNSKRLPWITVRPDPIGLLRDLFSNKFFNGDIRIIHLANKMLNINSSFVLLESLRHILFGNASV